MINPKEYRIREIKKGRNTKTEKTVDFNQSNNINKPYYEQRREAKGKGEKERYIHLHAEFQRITRRDKKAFVSDQSKK